MSPATQILQGSSYFYSPKNQGRFNPIFAARSIIKARAASYSLGITPSRMASLMALFKAPTSGVLTGSYSEIAAYAPYF